MCCVTDQSSLLGIFHRGVKNKNKKGSDGHTLIVINYQVMAQTKQNKKIITETNESKKKAKLKKKNEIFRYGA